MTNMRLFRKLFVWLNITRRGSLLLILQSSYYFPVVKWPFSLSNSSMMQTPHLYEPSSILLACFISSGHIGLAGLSYLGSTYNFQSFWLVVLSIHYFSEVLDEVKQMVPFFDIAAKPPLISGVCLILISGIPGVELTQNNSSFYTVWVYTY